MEKLDDLIDEFYSKVETAESKNRDVWEGPEADKTYDVDIRVYRKPGMGNSVQTIIGNKISIYVGVASLLETLVDKKVFTIEELKKNISGNRKPYKR